MKRYHPSTEDESKYISSTREIPPEEWNGFNKRMEQVNYETPKKFSGSLKNSLDIWVK